jgi:hypothetical protein
LEEMFKEARKQCPVRECGGWGSPVGMHSLHASCMCYWYGLCLCHCACMCEIHPFVSGERMQSSNILST